VPRLARILEPFSTMVGAWWVAAQPFKIAQGKKVAAVLAEVVHARAAGASQPMEARLWRNVSLRSCALCRRGHCCQPPRHRPVQSLLRRRLHDCMQGLHAALEQERLEFESPAFVPGVLCVQRDARWHVVLVPVGPFSADRACLITCMFWKHAAEAPHSHDHGTKFPHPYIRTEASINGEFVRKNGFAVGSDNSPFMESSYATSSS